MVRGTSSADRIDGWRDRTGPATITRTQGSLVVSGKTKPFPLWNEGEEKTSSPSFLALIMDGVEAASRVCDERRCAAPLTPLPPRWGLVSLDNANVVIDRMTLLSKPAWTLCDSQPANTSVALARRKVTALQAGVP